MYCYEELREEDRLAFERELYRAYKKDGGWYFTHFTQKGNERLAPPFPYEDLRVAVAKHDGAIVAGMLSHINSEQRFFLEDMGFTLEKEKGVCEGANTFISDGVPEKEKINVLISLGDFSKNVLIENEIRVVYAAPQVQYVNMHHWIFEYDEEGEERIVEGESRRLLKKYLTR